MTPPVGRNDLSNGIKLRIESRSSSEDYKLILKDLLNLIYPPVKHCIAVSETSCKLQLSNEWEHQLEITVEEADVGNIIRIHYQVPAGSQFVRSNIAIQYLGNIFCSCNTILCNSHIKSMYLEH